MNRNPVYHGVMNTLRLAAAVSMLALAATPLRAAESKVVVELFTSQGCSSCPPADKLLGELAENKNLVALSLPVDYWDYLGWHDTLAQAAFSQRQRGYSESRGGHEVFTPQVVVNGITQVVGSDRRAIESAAATAANGKSVPVTLAKNGSTVEVNVGAGDNAPAAVWLLAISQAKPVAIGRGENHGKTIVYHNVVRGWKKLCDFSGAPVKQSVSLQDLGADDADMVAVLVQPGSVEKPGPIKGAAALSLR
jgi:hypothetical protein